MDSEQSSLRPKTHPEGRVPDEVDLEAEPVAHSILVAPQTQDDFLRDPRQRYCAKIQDRGE